MSAFPRHDTSLSGPAATSAGARGAGCALQLLSRCIHHDSRYPDSRILASGWLLGRAAIAKRSALVDAKIGQPPIRVDVAPGSKWRYSGGGYEVTQQLVFDVSGKP